MLLCIIKACLVTSSPLAYFRHAEALCYLTRKEFALWVSIIILNLSPGHRSWNYCFLFYPITEADLERIILLNFSHNFGESRGHYQLRDKSIAQKQRSLSRTVSGWWRTWASWDLSKARLGMWASRSKTWRVRHNALVRRCKSSLENLALTT